jgi:hypothetical protein
MLPYILCAFNLNSLSYFHDTVKDIMQYTRYNSTWQTFQIHGDSSRNT